MGTNPNVQRTLPSNQMGTVLKNAWFTKLACLNKLVCKATVLLFCLLAASLSSAHADLYDIIDLAKAGCGEDVLLAYIDSHNETYDLSTTDIVYLKDIGVPETVIAEMLRRPAEMADVALQPEGGPLVVRDYSALNEIPEGEALDESHFYSALSPYGRWLETEEYGSVWQPYHTVHHEDWAPYRDGGRWIQVTSSGWTWHSDYTWGWAPFHYGRWTYHPRHRWIWTPGRVWAPAWVSWRRCDTHIGWAPLPPEAVFAPEVGFTHYGRPVTRGFEFGLSFRDYHFVRWPHFGGDYHRHCLRPWSSRPVYESSQVVLGLSFSNGHFNNVGVELAYVNSHLVEPIRPCGLRSYHGHGGPIRAGYYDEDDYCLYRPVIRPTRTWTPQQAVAQQQQKLEEIERRRQIRAARKEFRQDKSGHSTQIKEARKLAAQRIKEARQTSKQLLKAVVPNKENPKETRQERERIRKQFYAERRAETQKRLEKAKEQRGEIKSAKKEFKDKRKEINTSPVLKDTPPYETAGHGHRAGKKQEAKAALKERKEATAQKYQHKRQVKKTAQQERKEELEKMKEREKQAAAAKQAQRQAALEKEAKEKALRKALAEQKHAQKKAEQEAQRQQQLAQDRERQRLKAAEIETRRRAEEQKRQAQQAKKAEHQRQAAQQAQQQRKEAEAKRAQKQAQQAQEEQARRDKREQRKQEREERKAK